MAKYLRKRAHRLQIRREAWNTIDRNSHYMTLDDKQRATKRPGSMSGRK